MLVTKDERHKRRMVIDYSQTINRFTPLDAYPLPRIDEMVEKIAQHEVYSTLDLRSAYHQVPILESERDFTAFEADGQLFRFKRIPFGVTNGVSCFQRVMDDIIKTNTLKGVFAYLDNVTVVGASQEEHDDNLKKFMESARCCNIEFNHDKSVFSVRKLNILGFTVTKGLIRPDEERLRSLREMEPPANAKSLKRIIGLFAYYSQWIHKFSDKLQPLINNSSFQMTPEATDSFGALKEDVINSALVTINDNIPLVVESDASEHTLAATLSQNCRPIAFFTRMLSDSEKKLSKFR